MMAKTQIGASSVIATSVFTLTFVLIGIPLWWKTTEVYRYPIPHDECQQLLSETINHAVHVKLVLADRGIQQGVLWENLLQITKEADKSSPSHSVTFHWSMSSVTEQDELMIKKSTNISELDMAFYFHDEATKVHPTSSGELQILILQKNFTNGAKFWIGRFKQAYILNDADSKYLAQDILTLAKKMAQVERLQKLFIPASFRTVDKKPDKDRMRHLRSSTNFDITFSLIVPEPQYLDVQWNIEEAINAYISPMLEDLALISAVDVKSQILYMTSLAMPTQLSLDAKGEEYVLNSEHLHTLINPIEARLGSDVSVYPSLNFVLYIPTKEQTPLRIHNSKGNPVGTNAFLSPQWGGIMIYNCPVPENSSLPYSVHINERIFMEVFLSQLRLLLGLPEMVDLNDETFQTLPSSGISKWEFDFLLRKNAQEQISAAASSLASLSHLLHSIRNIVIRDDVGQKIYSAVSSTKESLKLLSEGYLKEGFLKAQSAFIASEEAFFDPSLLALLYFPEDQKYAIYIPLFLPISIPVVTSISRLWRFWQDRKKIKVD